MKNISIRINPGHQMDGEGEKIGVDYDGEQYTFWKSSGSMEVPLEIAQRLELEVPKRFEIVDRNLANKILGDSPLFEVKKPIEDKKVTAGTNIQDIAWVLHQVEKLYDLSKQEQIVLLNQLKIPIDPKGHEFDRVKKIILSGYKI